MKRMADVAEVQGWKYEEDEEGKNDPDSILLRKVPKKTLVYEINGPMFFGAADKFMDVSIDADVKVVVLRMRSVPAMDTTAMRSLNMVYEKCKRAGVVLLLSHVQNQPYKVMNKAGFVDKVGKEHFCINIDTALEKAAGFVK